MFKMFIKNIIKNFVLNELLPAVSAELANRSASDLEKAAADVALAILKEKLAEKL